MLLAKLLVVILCLLIFVEDMVSRAVHWFWFPLLFGVLIAISLGNGNGFGLVVRQTGMNLGFVMFQIFFLTLYFSLKKGRVINIMNGMLGWGDVLFLTCLTAGFSFINYVIFYIASLVIVLFIWLIIQLIVGTTEKRIPLAGLQAGLFAGFFLLVWVFPIVNLNDETWLINKIVL